MNRRELIKGTACAAVVASLAPIAAVEEFASVVIGSHLNVRKWGAWTFEVVGKDVDGLKVVETIVLGKRTAKPFRTIDTVIATGPGSGGWDDHPPISRFAYHKETI